MSADATLPPAGKPGPAEHARAQERFRRQPSAVAPFRMASYLNDHETAQRQAELFYLQKQIQAQTPMVIVLEDGEEVEGCVEWYDRCCIKVRGRARTLVYKSAIKYMYKKGDTGQ
jgi:sRNA-binding regulator protein Hfq